jgi:hypothetical protein
MDINWNAISAIATSVSALAVIFAMLQLRLTKRVSQLQFEDSLAKEYRELAGRIPPKALLGGKLSREEYKRTYDELFHYIDLSNEQCMLRSQGRVNRQVWKSWLQGIETNLKLQAFSQVWTDVKGRTENFRELRELEKDFSKDPFKGGFLAWIRTGNC